MSIARLRIGNYTFSLNPRDELDFDFARAIPKIDTIGNPTYQDVGVDEKTLSFSGVLTGTDAWSQAELLESMMDAGSPLTLLFGPIQRTVRIEHVSPKMHRFDYVEYDLELIIIPASSGFVPPPPAPPANAAVAPAPAAPATTSTASIAQHMDKTYTVQSGDTLWGIAQRSLGSGASANDISALANTVAKANGVTNPRLLQIGTVLKIPSSANVSSANTAYTGRQTAVVTSSGVSYLQTQANTSRYKAVPI